MASLPPRPDPIEDTLCPICKDPMRSPVSVNCGHNFCEDCISQYFEKWSEVAKMLCPVCRVRIKKESIRPNWQLANLVENVLNQSESTGKGDLCITHKKKRLLFCKEDKEVMCWVCERATKHNSHCVLTLEEAAPVYKDQLRNCLKTLKKKGKEVLSHKINMEKESQDLLEQVKAEREKTMRTFTQLHQFLEEQEKLLLARMEEVMEEIERERENHLEKLEKEHQSLESIIQEMEEKLQQPAVDLLQDIRSFMERCEGQNNCMSSPITFPAALKWKIWDFCDINPFLEGITKQFQDSLVSGLQLQKVNVHLDPGTAHRMLIVSEDCKSVRWTETLQDVPDNPKRFDFWSFVLGCEEFTAGRHFWEVFVGPVGWWSVGVTRKHVKGKEEIGNLPKGGIWDMGRWAGAYQSSALGICNKLSLNEEPRKIRVALNCEGGRVAFYDADRTTLIYVYSGAPFAKETLRPFCSLCGNGHLALSC